MYFIREVSELTHQELESILLSWGGQVTLLKAVLILQRVCQ